MNRFATFYMLALFCILSAPAQADPEKYCKIKAASIDDEVDSQTFDQGELYLYKTVDAEAGEISYAIGNNLEKLSLNFSISQRNTVVTADNITIRWLLRYITLTLYGDTFEFYQNLFSLEKLPYTFPVTKASVGSTVLTNVFAIEAKLVEREEWIFVAVDGNTPRLIFPASSVELLSIEDFFEVTFTLKLKEDIPIILEFNETIFAEVFYLFIRTEDSEEESEDSPESTKN